MHTSATSGSVQPGFNNPTMPSKLLMAIGEVGAQQISLPPTLSAKEAARILNQSVSTVERYAAAGILPTLVHRGTGAPRRIITTRLLAEHLGYSSEQVMAIVRFQCGAHPSPPRR